MKIAFVPGDYHGCGYYRMILPAMALGARGHSVSIDAKTTNIYAADIVVWQRPHTERHLEVARDIKQLGKKNVVDADDNLLQLEPDNRAFYYYSREVLDAYETALREADAVTVSTPPLAESMKRLNPSVHVLRNCLDEMALAKERRPSDRVIVGWAGGEAHFTDLKSIRNVINNLKKVYDFDLVLAGFDPGEGIFKDYHHRAWMQLEPNLNYYHNFADYGIGIAPISKTIFNEAKSDVKFLEYSVFRTPTIASKSVTYETIKHGETGYLARNLNDWETYIGELIAEPERRDRMGEAARAYVAEERIIQKNIRLWEEVYENL